MLMAQENKTLRTRRPPLSQIAGEGSADLLGHREDPLPGRLLDRITTPLPVQFTSSNERRNTSPARRPSLANKSSTARLRLSRASSDGHTDRTKSSCSGERWRGREACLDPRSGGTAPSKPARICPWQVRKRNRLRIAVTGPCWLNLESSSARYNTKA